MPGAVKQEGAPPRIKGETEVSDETLMDRYCAGDKLAFDALFLRYNGRLQRFLTQMVGPAQAADTAQIALFRVHQNRHRYRVGAKFSSWIFAIARNAALDHIRSAPQRREVRGVEIDRGEEGPDTDLWRDEQVREAVGKLGEDQRDVILLHWFGGLTFSEVAQVMGTSGSAVRVRAHRAYEKLRDHLKALEAEVKS